MCMSKQYLPFDFKLPAGYVSKQITLGAHTDVMNGIEKGTPCSYSPDLSLRGGDKLSKIDLW